MLDRRAFHAIAIAIAPSHAASATNMPTKLLDFLPQKRLAVEPAGKACGPVYDGSAPGAVVGFGAESPDDAADWAGSGRKGSTRAMNR